MINAAILGFGTVGSGVAEVLTKNAEKITRGASQEIHLKYILDVRDFSGSPYAELFVKDFSVIENDPSVKVVAEVIGGVGAAYEFTKRSICAGKSVVTSNKELVATHGCELLKLAADNGVSYLFEASVGGGIPIIRPISQCLAANRITELYGILNGTTNYILTQMIQCGASFEDALKEAQSKGYAERNPAADIEGVDACRKICILASLAFGKHIYPQFVPAEGITGVSLADVDAARSAGYRIKLLGRAVAVDENRAACYVAPHLINEHSPLANVEGVMNGIVVRGNAIGDVMFYGAGAGKLPTASAVVADMIDIAGHLPARRQLSWAEGSAENASDPSELESRFFVRANCSAEKASAAFGDIASLGGKDGFAFITSKMSRSEADKRLAGLGALSVFRVLD